MALRLALAQINPTVGDLGGNREKILARLKEARDLGADVVAFPEMALTGYPPEDLLLKADFVKGAARSLEEIRPATKGLTAIIGTILAEDALYNAAAVLHDGALVAHYRKQSLPNYGVFDEKRYFRAGSDRILFRRAGVTFGVSVCEDIWYADGPPSAQAAAGADLLLNISASPYHMGKGQARERMLTQRATDAQAFVAYCNLAGGQDELVFDGQALVVGPQGQALARARQFAEDLLVADIDPSTGSRGPRNAPQPPSAEGGFRLVDLPEPSRQRPPTRPAASPRMEEPLAPLAEVYQALITGTRDYVHKNGFRQVVLGLSGGVDSSLTAAIAADALGGGNVMGVAMPTRYSSAHSCDDAESLARNLGLRFLTVPIDGVFQSFLDALAPSFQGKTPDVTEENLQPRVRGTVLMALSNKFGWLVLTTGNKSEVGVGYSTLYGDTAGGFAVIKDVPKTLVYALSRHRNALAGKDVIPQRVLDKPPSAELRPDQKDTDSLPDYAILDPILQAYVEENCTPMEIAARGFEEATVRRVVGMVDRNEYKRRQNPPGIKITPRAFGKDWRLPVTNRYAG